MDGDGGLVEGPFVDDGGAIANELFLLVKGLIGEGEDGEGVECVGHVISHDCGVCIRCRCGGNSRIGGVIVGVKDWSSSSISSLVDGVITPDGGELLVGGGAQSKASGCCWDDIGESVWVDLIIDGSANAHGQKEELLCAIKPELFGGSGGCGWLEGPLIGSSNGGEFSEDAVSVGEGREELLECGGSLDAFAVSGEILDDGERKKEFLILLGFGIKVGGLVFLDEFFEISDVTTEIDEIVVTADGLEGDCLRGDTDLLKGRVTMIFKTTTVVKNMTNMARESFINGSEGCVEIQIDQFSFEGGVSCEGSAGGWDVFAVVTTPFKDDTGLSLFHELGKTNIKIFLLFDNAG